MPRTEPAGGQRLGQRADEQAAEAHAEVQPAAVHERHLRRLVGGEHDALPLRPRHDARPVHEPELGHAQHDHASRIEREPHTRAVARQRIDERDGDAQLARA
jgi:hypothetical protein